MSGMPICDKIDEMIATAKARGEHPSAITMSRQMRRDLRSELMGGGGVVCVSMSDGLGHLVDTYDNTPIRIVEDQEYVEVIS